MAGLRDDVVCAQERVISVIAERLPRTPLLSIGQRPELEMFHHRKLIMRARSRHARVVADHPIGPSRGPVAGPLDLIGS